MPGDGDWPSPGALVSSDSDLQDSASAARLTVNLTVEPRSTVVPAAGDWLTTPHLWSPSPWYSTLAASPARSRR